jgi:hypothetical protein
VVLFVVSFGPAVGAVTWMRCPLGPSMVAAWNAAEVKASALAAGGPPLSVRWVHGVFQCLVSVVPVGFQVGEAVYGGLVLAGVLMLGLLGVIGAA